MSTDLAVRQNTDLIHFAEEASQVHGIAKALAGTSFVPKTMQGRPDDITGAILFGRELGMDPMTALQTINVIEGRPTLTANAMRGLAMSAGVIFQVLESSDTRCVMRARGPNQEGWTGTTWDLDRAKKLGLTSKQNWQKQPRAMLIARATSELCRLVAANVLIGLPYSSEELSDGGSDLEVSTVDDPPVEEPKRTLRRKPVPATVAEPEPARLKEPDAIGYTPVDVAPREIEQTVVINPELRKALMATFNDAGIRSREERLAYVSDVVGREISSVNQLDNDEARSVLDRLRGDGQESTKQWVEAGQ